MTPMERILKDMRNPLLTKQTTEALEDSYVQLERVWLHAKMYEASGKSIKEIDEIIKTIYNQ